MRFTLVAGAVLLLALVAALAFETGRRWPLSMFAREPALPAPWRVVATTERPHYESIRVLIGRRMFVFGGFITARGHVIRHVDVLDLDAGTWTRRRDMPVAVTHSMAALVRDTVWLAGGFIGDSPGPTTDRVWRYAPADDAWSEGPRLPAPRGSGSLLARGDTLHFIGGWYPDRSTDAADHWSLAPGDTVWRRRAPLPQPRGHAAAAVVDGALYVLGGTVSHDPIPLDVDPVHRYEPDRDRWVTMPPLPFALSHAEPATMTWRGTILIAGGRSQATRRRNLDEVLRYDPATGVTDVIARLPRPLLAPLAAVSGDTLFAGLGGEAGNDPRNPYVWKVPLTVWQTLDPMPVALGEVAAAVIGERLFVVGQGSSVTLALDLRSGRWDAPETWPARPAPGDHHAAEVVNGRLILLGGFGGQPVGAVQVFDPVARRWTLGPMLPSAVGSAASAVIGGRLIVAGGIVANRTTGRTVILDSLSGAWREVSPMPRPRNHAAAATDGTRLFVFGGRGPGSGDNNTVANGFADVQIYDPRTDRWTVSDGAPGSPRPLPQARGGTGKAVFVRGEFWIIGGETRDGAGAGPRGTYDRTDIYDPATNTWREGPRLAAARHGIFPVLAGDRLVVAGGGTARGHSHSDVVESLILP